MKEKDNQLTLLTDHRTYLEQRINDLKTFQIREYKSKRIEKAVMWGVIVLQSGVILVAGVASISNQ